MPNTSHRSPRSRGLVPHRAGARRTRLAGLCLLGALVAGLGPAAAQEAVDLDDLRSQRDEAREEQLQAQAAVDALNAEFEDVEAAFLAADELVAAAEARAEAIETQLAMVELRLARTEVGIAWAEYDREQLDEDITDLAIREYLGLQDRENPLAEDDPTAAVARNAVVNVVQGAGFDVLDTARTAEQQYLALRDAAELDKAAIEELNAELEHELEDLEAAREVRQRARDALDERRNMWLGRLDDLERQEADFTDQIKAEQRRLDAERARERAAAAREEATAGFDATWSAEGYIWPTAGGIGSYFGPRRHPILGITRLHGGLDIGGRMGQPIWAAKEGVVILAGVNGGYGNTIVVDHGNGYVSLYGHQSSFEVKKGDYVETGQHIGNVGSTGLSTGPHLHFEIRIDGSVVDPLPYLPNR